jgi:transposase
MSHHSSKLTGEQSSKIDLLLPKRKRSAEGGRNRIDRRRFFESVLWVLWAVARLKDLPSQYPTPATC